MPPTVKITKEDIIKTAMEGVRKHGEAALNARAIAANLQCSTQPIFSNFATMADLRKAVIFAVEELSAEYIKKEIEKNIYPPYKATGMAYIRFAKEEKELFHLLYMRNRSSEGEDDESSSFREMKKMVQELTGLEEGSAALFHLEMWTFTHGIATLVATEFCDLSFELISTMMTDAYQGLRKRYEKG